MGVVGRLDTHRQTHTDTHRHTQTHTQTWIVIVLQGMKMNVHFKPNITIYNLKTEWKFMKSR